MVAYTNYDRDPRVRRNAEALVNANFEVDVIALKENGQPSSEEISGVRVFHVPFSKIRGSKISYIFAYAVFFLLSFIYISIFHLQKKYELILIYNMPDFLVFSAVVPKLMGTPILLDIRDPMPELFGSIFNGKGNNFFRSILLFEEKISFNFCNKLMTVHKEMYGLLINRGINSDRLEIVQNLPDTSIFHKIIPAEKNINYFTLVYAGTVSPRNHLDLVIEAISNLRTELPRLRFLIIGDGPDISRLRGLSRDFEIEEMVVFKGAVPVNAVPELLADCDAAIASYADDENGNLVFPTKVFEALEVGLPVICTKVRTVQDYLDDDALFYFSPGDLDSLITQIRKVHQNPDLAKEKTINGQKFLLNDNWENEKLKLIQLVRTMIHGKI
jgi:glycosyltransferase involved in cell wall biosynthesis